MSRRFTKSLQEKYGSSGIKGRAGELFFKEFYEDKGYTVVDNNDNISLQSKGIDFIIRTPVGEYTVDVKNNLNNNNEIVVEVQPDGWLFNPKKISEYISHVNARIGSVVTYKRKCMQDFIDRNYWDYRHNFIYLPIIDLPFAKIEKTVKEQ